MQLYLFVSRPKPNIEAFTGDRTGANLPPDYAPWDRSGLGSMLVGQDGGEVVAAVQREGYFLMNGQRIARSSEGSSL
jgi:hypothetical protein